MRRFFSNAALALVLTVLCVAVLFGVNRLAAPMKKILPPTGASSPDYKMLIGEISEPSLLQDLLILSHSPSRFSGSRDCEMVGEYIAHALRESGYKVLEQPCRLTLPVTKYARVLDEAGRELDGIRIHPFLPNWFRTVTTPEGGIRGRVLRGELGSAEEFKGAQMEGNFVLLPLGISWKTAAGMGAKAVLYSMTGVPRGVHTRRRKGSPPYRRGRRSP